MPKRETLLVDLDELSINIPEEERTLVFHAEDVTKDHKLKIVRKGWHNGHPYAVLSCSPHCCPWPYGVTAVIPLQSEGGKGQPIDEYPTSGDTPEDTPPDRRVG